VEIDRFVTCGGGIGDDGDCDDRAYYIRRDQQNEQSNGKAKQSKGVGCLVRQTRTDVNVVSAAVDDCIRRKPLDADDGNGFGELLVISLTQHKAHKVRAADNIKSSQRQ
jgi:hypothetical protein